MLPERQIDSFGLWWKKNQTIWKRSQKTTDLLISRSKEKTEVRMRPYIPKFSYLIREDKKIYMIWRSSALFHHQDEM